MKLTILAVLLASLTILPAKAATMLANESLVTDFIESDRLCKTDSAKCDHVIVLCQFMTDERKRELRYFIRNEYPFKTKNGGMNIMARYTRALRKCTDQ